MSPNSVPSLLGMMADLIAQPSISSVNPEFDQSNQSVVDLLAGWLADLGFKTEVLPIPAFPGKYNLIATLGSGPGGLVLAGHTDTVPFDDSSWRSDPFKLTERDHRYHGLGTADMKSFFALILEAARKYRAEDLQQPLIVLATADEESSMCGAQALVESGKPRARYAVIGEPTGMRPIHAHKGILMEAVHILGQSGHSSNPRLGINAMEGLPVVIKTLLDWRTELQRKYHQENFDPPEPTLNLGHVHGGDNPNRICAACELQFDLRPLPGMSLEDLRADLSRRLDHAFKDSALKVNRTSLIDGTEPMATSCESQIVREAERLTGHPAQTASYCTEGPYLNALGMETIILGPGNIAQAHRPDEFIAAETLKTTVEMLDRFIQKFCVSPQP